MCGCGAERVASLLANHFLLEGYEVKVILTHQNKNKIDLQYLDEAIHVISLDNEVQTISRTLGLRLWLARILGKVLFFFTKSFDKGLVLKYASSNYNKIKWMKCFFRKHHDATLVAFLYDSIFLSLLSKDKSNRLIISERGDPSQSLESKTVLAFFKTMFREADVMVFQSPDVFKWYKENFGINGTVIFNPITPNLPEPYHGKRNKHIVNFCRINPQKNIVLLIDAFEKIQNEYTDYELWIYGHSDHNYRNYINNRIKNCNCPNNIHICPATENIHSIIIDSAMFVSSSDFEGMSNSMLEAMAIGLPVICTDCPAGGARAVINDHENGLLVPVKDSHALYLAMKELIDNPELAKKISKNAIKIRVSQSKNNIMEQWDALVKSQK